ncbi:MAG: lysylphosphatidylglycerol synthase domain-containing protein [Acidimicrobiales bacterium]
MGPVEQLPIAPTRRRARLFSSGVDEPRARRATDIILVIAAAVALGLLSLVAVPQAGYERALTTLARAVPGVFDSLWRLLVDLLGLIAVVLVVATIVRRRFTLLRDLVLAAVVALAIAVIVERAAVSAWPAASGSLRITGAWFSPLRLSVPAAVAMAASPHLSQPARRVDWWVVLLAALATVLLGAATPTGAMAGVAIAVMAAAVVHLAFGSCRGRPSLDDVVVALAGLGVATRSVGAADRQREGLFLVDATDAEGEPLVVKVYGRDANDTQLLTTMWRTVWYRETGSPTSVGRLQQVEHEAFLTLLAAQAGVPTARVVTAGATVEDDVLLVLRPWGHPVAGTPELWSDDLAREVWAALGRLHDAGVAHGQIDDRHLVVGGDGAATCQVGLADFRGGAVAAPDPRLRADEAQALVATVLALGEERALAVALEQLGPQALAAVLPFVQLTTLTPRQRQAIRDEGVDLDTVRDRAAELAGVDPPELEQLRRVSWSSVIQVVLLIVAFMALSRAIGGVDFAVLGDQIGDAIWWFVIVGFVLAQVTRLAQATATLGAAPERLPLRPVYALQLALSYIGLAVPTSAARVGVSIRFFQRHGLPSGSALAVGALDGFAGFVVQMVLLLGILVMTPASLELDLDNAAPIDLSRLLAVIVAIGVAVGIVLLARSTWRHRIVGWVRQLAIEAFGAVRGLRSPRRLGMLFGGNLASDVLFALALGAFTASLGWSIGLTELIFINISVSLLAGLLPIPGGIGVVEGGLTFGLVRAGMPEETALAAVLMYRLSTFYLPPIWGFFALKWLERNKHL